MIPGAEDRARRLPFEKGARGVHLPVWQELGIGVVEGRHRSLEGGPHRFEGRRRVERRVLNRNLGRGGPLGLLSGAAPRCRIAI